MLEKSFISLKKVRNYKTFQFSLIETVPPETLNAKNVFQSDHGNGRQKGHDCEAWISQT